uniref:GH16 domain-containing protein n=1 Tax=viral metagenome TaxID=1070528 RepID=A0A6C0EHH0_9ZZZZ
MFNKPLYNDFYTYSIEWKPNIINWYINDTLFFTATNENLKKINNNYNWIFNDRFFYLLVNTAVGGNFGGAFPNSINYIYKNLPNYNEMIIKHIKIYKTIDGYGEIKI